MAVFLFILVEKEIASTSTHNDKLVNMFFQSFYKIAFSANDCDKFLRNVFANYSINHVLISFWKLSSDSRASLLLKLLLFDVSSISL